MGYRMSNERRVLLYSQGLDSFIMSKLIPHDEKLFIITGTKDNEVERDRISQSDFDVSILDLSFLAQFELANKIIPFRNMFFALAAAQYGSVILMASTKGDTTRDKDDVFGHLMSAMMSYFGMGSVDKVRYSGPCRIELPFRQYTKRELVQMYLDTGFPREDLVRQSSSCYFPIDGQECGRCRSCLRKFTALALNGISPSFEVPTTSLLEEHLNESIRKGREQEAEEIKEVLCRI